MHAVVGDFEHHLDRPPARRHAGSSRSSAARSATSRPSRAPSSSPTLAATLAPGDALLLGTDLVKDVDRLVAAYDDAAGVTAEFNRNVLRVLNRELDADFDPDAFEHVARVGRRRRVDRDAAARRTAPRPCTIRALDLDVEFAAGEEMRTEISAKFRRDRRRARARRRRPRARPSGGPTPPATSRSPSRSPASDSAARIPPRGTDA